MRFRLVVATSLVLAACSGAEAATVPSSTVAAISPLAPATTTGSAPTSAAATTLPRATTTTTTTTLPHTNTLELVELTTITGDIAPKSVVSNGAGLFFAQNMMYRHTITVYDTSHQLVATIPDSIVLADYGLSEYDTAFRGAPVEAVPTADGSHLYVSNYEMYGPGYGNPGDDGCNQAGWDESLVYRIDTEALVVDQVIPVGAVPKFIAITPDDRLVLVTNWCSFDMSIIDTASGVETARVPIGRHPRGIAVTADGATAYVAVMGSQNLAVVNLDTLDVDWIRNVGANPRHVVLGPQGRYLYVTLNGEGAVAVVDLTTQSVVKRIRSGAAPRSMAISDDGSSLYVVNYLADTMSKIDTEALEVTQTLTVPHHPIGITFDSASREVWVASYTGFITVFRESEAES